MNQKNSLGLNNCFMDVDDPIELFKAWMNEATKTEPNDPNALSLATAGKNGVPTVRIVLLKDVNKNGFTFYTNFDSKKSMNIKENPNAAMCFHWKSLQRQIRVLGTVDKVEDKVADQYYNSRNYESRIGAWASNQSEVLKKRNDLLEKIENYKKKYPENTNVPRPKNWSGWNLNPKVIEFWLDGSSRIHERLEYVKINKNKWEKKLLSP
jgi:pyridoxamine 5'-phosphate oxidase